MKLKNIAFLALISPGLLAHEDESDTGHSVDTNIVPWVLVPIPELDHVLPVKPLFEDPETGVLLSKIKYEAGFTNSWHTHNTGHGMYVLDGILNTHKGNYGPGEFVWFPEGERMFHGATENNDAVMLFITNKKFDIKYEHTK